MQKRVDLLNGKIVTSLARLAFPLMGMSFIQMAYNLTDMLWIGRLGAGPVAAVGSAGLFMWLSMGVNTLAQIGGQIRVAHNLGAGNIQKAADYAKAALQLSTLLSLLMGVAFVLGAKPLIGFFNLNGADVIAQAEVYLRVVGVGLVFSCVAKTLISIITTTGDSNAPFVATFVGLLVNIVLDPILIFGFVGMPKLGVMGAAIATVFAQAIVLLMLVLYAKKDKHLFNHMSFFTLPNREYVLDILKLSWPATIQNILFPSIAMIISRLVASFGDNAVAVQRVGSQIESISWMTAEGFATAVNSFVAQNYGARNLKRAKRGYYVSLGLLSAWGLFSTSVLVFAAAPLFNLFIPQADILAMGVDYLVILGFSQLFMCVEILTTSAFNGFGQTALPAAINVILTAARVPASYLLSATALGLCGIWWSVTCSSILKGIILFAIFIVFLKRLRQPSMPTLESKAISY